MKKMKKLLSVTMSILLGVATLGFTACDDKHTHTFGDWSLVSAAADCEDATFGRTCSDCGHIENRRGSAQDHVWTEYAYGNTHHWAVCKNCDAEQDDAERHVDGGEGECKTCGCLIPTAGVTYELSEDSTYAIATGYDETETNIVVVAPTYEDVPVKAVADSAFEGCVNLARITLPEGMTSIGDNAFNGCKRLLGIFIHDTITEIGENAFGGCSELTIFCEAETPCETWNENWNPVDCKTVWGHEGTRMKEVSAKAIPILESMLCVNNPEKTQIELNPDLGGVKAPEGFTNLVRYDAKKEGAHAWTTSALWNYNFDQTDLREYSDIWFAVKFENAYWAFVGETGKNFGDSWTYIHLSQMGHDYLGYIMWRIEVSIGGYVHVVNENQSGQPYDSDRSMNSIALMLWDNGFSSKDGHAVLIYSIDYESANTFYCTEVVGVKVGA